MATREEAAQSILDAINELAPQVPANSGDFLRANGEAVKALAEAWEIVRVRGSNRGSAYVG